MTTLVGVDVGGTFTDLVLYDRETGDVRIAKQPTVPAAPEEGVRAVVDAAVPGDDLRRAGLFLHGTTVGLNTLLERKGAKVGLITTEGFRDILELRRGERDILYDLRWQPPPPLVSRRLRLTVQERLGADGEVVTPLEAGSVAEAAEVLAREEVESVAVALLHAYADPSHELEVERMLREHGFEGEIALSHRVTGEYREYERTSTTVADAYVRPRVAGYLQRLEQALRDKGLEGECLVTRSGGGAMSFAEARGRPVETIMSGPAAGGVGAGKLCERLGISEAITADVGGTSFDTCLILDGKPQLKYEGDVDGLPLQTPWVDVRSIGAGGGSIAHVDSGGLLRVGPHSAGADPGPACYAKGGTQATTTDAAAVLGMLGEGVLAGGVTIDVERARRAVEPIAAALGYDLDSAAEGIVTIASSAMANAIRSVTVEQGRDPRDSHVIAFGGAGPLLGTLLARELGIRRVVVPEHAGNFSARSLLGQDVVRSAAATSVRTLGPEALEAANRTLESLYEELRRRAGESADAGTATLEPALDLRYAGQEYTLTTAVPAKDGFVDADAETVAELFARNYERTFGHPMDEQIEIVSVRGTSRVSLGAGTPEPDFTGDAPEQPDEWPVLDAYSFAHRRRMPFSIVSRSSLAPGKPVQGPAIVVEATTTTYVDDGFEIELDPSGALLLTDQGASR